MVGGCASRSRRRSVIGVVAAAVGLSFVATLGAARQTTGVPLRAMLKEAYELVKKRYYDPAYHGVDWDRRYQDFDAKIRATTSVNAGLGAIAEFLDGLKDSHTYFLPPSRPFEHDYGYRLRIVGEKTLISRVLPKTDAEAKLQPGDEVLSINGFEPSRDTLFTVQYILEILAPLETVDLVIRKPGGARRQVQINAKIVEKPRRLAEWEPWAIYRTKDDPTRTEPHRVASIGDVMIWGMPSFRVEDRVVDNLWERARGHQSVILDLRGNPGGYKTALNRMLANVFDRDVKAYDVLERKGRTPENIKSRKGSAFTGTLMVLIDGDSASAAELFARVMQIERRGTVVGDRSMGAVMVGRLHEGESRHLIYGFMVTEADTIMTDGKSLERTGVVPDETILPTAEDLASGRDPVLARVAERVGLSLTPEAAGKLFEKKAP